jgi:hypothetical protein
MRAFLHFAFSAPIGAPPDRGLCWKLVLQPIEHLVQTTEDEEEFGLGPTYPEALSEIDI